MGDFLIHDSSLEDIADAIRSKTGGSSPISVGNMPNEIMSISGGSPSWTGTLAELEEVFDELEEGTQINITDDEQEVIEGGTIYSENEQCIGLWIDNKPLYQKSFSFTNGVAIAMGSWTDVNSDIPNIGYDKVVRAFSVDTNGTYQGDLLCGLNSSDHVQLQSQRNGSGNITANYITLQYTKTTDAVIDAVVGKRTMYIASSDCYSAAEKEIGVWLDGKPLYQKTVECGALPANTTKNVPHGITNIDRIVYVNGCAFRSTSGNEAGIPVPTVHYQTIGNQTQLSVDFTNITLRNSNANASTFDKTQVTIRYTKTTDAAGSGQYTPSNGKAVHYSEDEQVVGTWIDGSTIYEKTYYLTTAISVPVNGTWVDTGINISFVSKMIEATIGNDIWIFGVLSAFKDSNNLKLTSGGSMGSNNLTVKRITIRYTKSS